MLLSPLHPSVSLLQGDLADNVIALTDAAKRIKMLQNSSIEVELMAILAWPDLTSPALLLPCSRRSLTALPAA
jgi:hypothetical protein